MKLDRTMQKRLSNLQRGQTGSLATATPEEKTLATAPPVHGRIQTVGEAEDRHGPLEELLAGSPQAGAEGEYWELVTPVAAYGEWAKQAVQRWLDATSSGHFAGELLPSRTRVGNLSPEGVVFFDTETTGLNNEPLFLVGMLCHDAGGAYIRQLLARDYAEEAAVLGEARRLLAQAEVIVSYNGITFDVPYLRNRLLYHRMGKLELPEHLDLLPVARRKLGRSLGNCRLQTLERHLCGRERCNDIGGAQIPQAYHDFVAEGDAGQLRRIIEHNSFDVITLAEITAHLLRP